LGILAIQRQNTPGGFTVGKCDFISSNTAAGICLGEMSFPASKQEIIDQIEDAGGAEAAIVAINQVPDRIYASLEELTKYLEGEL